MSNFSLRAIIFGAAAALALPSFAADAPAAAPAAPKVVHKAAAKKSVAKKAVEAEEPEEKTDDLTAGGSVEFQCSLGDKLEIYSIATDDSHIAMKWHSRLHRLTRVATTTGADRFESTRDGLVWVGIPAKGILLDSRKGQQLANDCKNADQRKAETTAAASPATGAAGSSLFK